MPSFLSSSIASSPRRAASCRYRVWPVGQGGELVRHRFWDQQLGTEQADLPHHEEGPVHDCRSVGQVSPGSDVLARRHQVACDTESVRELTPLGHAQPQAEPADHPRYGCGDEEVEILPDEHEQRDADDDTDQKPEAAEQHPGEQLRSWNVTK